jgi:hypothetical protein
MGSLHVLHFALPFAAFVRVAEAAVAAPSAFGTLQSMVERGFSLIDGAYQRAPILVLVLSALVILPAVALISFAAHARMRSRSRQAAVRAAQRRAERGDPVREAPDAAPAWPLQAWLTIEGRSSDTVPLAGQLIRIGRHEDNDIRLADRSVHRHHAVIERTSEDVFVIADVSGKDGSGVRVNGQRTPRTRLADGDVIELGRARLRFETAPM